MPRRPPRGRPPKDKVLLWMEVNEKGPAEAARHFGIPASTVRSWVNRARAKAERRNDDNADGGGKKAEPEAGRRNGQTRAGAGRVALRTADLDEEAAPLMRAAAIRLLRYMAGALEDEAPALDPAALKDLPRDQRRTIEKALGATSWDPRGAKDAALGLAILVDKCPGILTLNERIDAGGSDLAGDGAVGGADAVERLQGALREE